MKLFILILILTNSLLANDKGVLHNINIIRVIDGDTIVFEAKWLPAPLKPELKLRVYGIDTPEKGARAKCEKESKLGEEATTFTSKKIKEGKTFQMYLIDWDKYGGRVLGDLLIDGKSLQKMLLYTGHGKEYYGDQKKSWCI